MDIFIIVGENIAMQLSLHSCPNDMKFSYIVGNKVACLDVVEFFIW